MNCRGVIQKFQDAINTVNNRCGDYETQEKQSLRYFRKVINSVNKREGENESQTRNSRKGLVKIYSLRNNRATHSDPRIDWIMLQKIYEIYRELKHQDTLQALIEIQNLKSHKYFSPPQPY